MGFKMYGFMYIQARYEQERIAHSRDIKASAECFDSRYRRAGAVAGIANRAEEIKKQIEGLDKAAPDYEKRYARLVRILSDLQGTLSRCR